jgi:DNA-binding MarR family transcriptional regulator
MLIRSPDNPVPICDIAVALLRIRRKRNAVFGSGLFADPAWDMLLDLFVAEASGRQVSVTSLCIASGVPSTTALRYIEILERDELVIRIPDEDDRRRNWIELAPATSILLEQLLDEL